MKIKHTLKNELNGKLSVVIVDDATSPRSGYTQAYADRAGKDYAANQAAGNLGGSSWTHVESQYVKDKLVGYKSQDIMAAAIHTRSLIGKYLETCAELDIKTLMDKLIELKYCPIEAYDIATEGHKLKPNEWYSAEEFDVKAKQLGYNNTKDIELLSSLIHKATIDAFNYGIKKSCALFAGNINHLREAKKLTLNP